MTDRQSELHNCLLEAESVTKFLGDAYLILGSKRPSYSYSQFAKQAGFKARSYGRAIVLGLKPVSLNAYVQLVSLFKLNKEYAEYLKLLIAKTQKNFHEVQYTGEELLRQLEKLKFKILRHADIKPVDDLDIEVFSSREHLIVYSCVESTGSGSRFKDICERSHIEKGRCRQILDGFVSKGLLEKVFKDDAYRADDSLMIAQELGGKNFFNEVWVESARKVLQKSETKMANRENFFVSTHMLIDKSKVMDFRIELQSLLEKFVDEWCDKPGDQLIELVLGMTPIQSPEDI